jgi:hypothetical protein
MHRDMIPVDRQKVEDNESSDIPSRIRARLTAQPNA